MPAENASDPVKSAELCDRKILITGPTSQVGLPVVAALARRNEVFGLARFRRPEERERVEALGARTVAMDLADGSFDGLPRDFDTVLNFAVVKSGDFAYDLEANAEGAGRLMSHCRDATAFLHCSSAGVYAYAGHQELAESAPLGDNHRAMLPTYSLSKIAAETVVRFAAREWQIPTVIARLSVPYGNNGGWPWFHLMMMKGGAEIPLHPEKPNLFNPIHEDDYIGQLPRLLGLASTPASVVNWGGPQASIEEWCAILGELTGLEPRFRQTEKTIGSVTLDLTRMAETLGQARVPLREGLRRMVEERNPELLSS
jgi:nucleoside-diphosphate-sugar epimerase